MKSTSCRPAASRRPGPSRRPTPIVRDANGQALAYVYFEEEPGALSPYRHARPATI